jgi:hypothetical protein
LILLRLLLLAAMNGWTITEGYAPRYDPGGMAHVANMRGLTHARCMVSSPTVGIAEWVYVVSKNNGAVRYCKVVDTSEAIDRARHIRTRRIVELSFADARALCGHTTEPPESCPVMVISEY